MFLLTKAESVEKVYKTHSLLPVWAQALIISVIAIIGLVIGILIAVYLLQKYLKENNPLTEKNIKNLGKQLTGRDLSDKQAKRIIHAMEEADTKKKKEAEKLAKKQAKKAQKLNNKNTKGVK